MRRIIAVLAAAALLGGAVTTVDAAGAKRHGTRAHAKKLRLKPFASCPDLFEYARLHAHREIRYANGPVVAPSPGPSFAQTDDTPVGNGQDSGGDTPGASGTPSEAPAPAPESGDSSTTN